MTAGNDAAGLLAFVTAAGRTSVRAIALTLAAAAAAVGLDGGRDRQASDDLEPFSGRSRRGRSIGKLVLGPLAPRHAGWPLQPR